MAKTIMLNSRFWEDNYISDLDALQKLLFIYFISNPRVSISGIYEVPLRNIALDTGLNEDFIKESIKIFTQGKKIAYIDGWVCIINYPKYQNYTSPTIKIALNNEIKIIPSNILDLFIGIGYPIDTLSILIKGKVKAKGMVKDKEEEENFEKFWKEYPKKIAKKEAEKAFYKKRPIDLISLMDGLYKWKKSEQWTKDKGRYIPHPTTWLNQERWNDEIEIKNDKTSKYDKFN